MNKFFFTAIFLWSALANAQSDTMRRVRFFSEERIAVINVLQELDEYLSPDWIIEGTDTSIRFTFCRSCKEEWWKQKDSIRLVRTNLADSGIGRNADLWEMEKYRPSPNSLNTSNLDSVGYYGWLNPPYHYGYPDRKYQQDRYAPFGTLEFEVRFIEGLEAKKLDSIQKLNEFLWETFSANTPNQFGCSPCLHAQHDMRNCRLAEGTFEERKIIDSLDLALTKEPYFSEELKRYVYFFSTIPLNNLDIVYCDKQDEDYFLKQKNFIKGEVYASMLVIYRILGLSEE